MQYSYPNIPTLCQCGCNEVLWHRGQQYITGHDSKHHPKVFWNKETTAEYYKKRRDILDLHGFLDSKLIVTTNLNELPCITGEL